MASIMVSPADQEGPLALDETCRRIPPLWPLQNFVAVNPFLGLSGMRFEEAARLIAQVAHGPILMETDYYLARVRNGSITASNIRAALYRCPGEVEPVDPVAWLENQLQGNEPSERILSVADWLDYSLGTNWAAFVVEEISKWCSSYFDQGQCSWDLPWRNLTLYQAWKRAAAADANPEVFGLKDFRRHVNDLPESEDDAIEYALNRLNIPTTMVNDFLHRELMTVSGWSAYAAYQDRQGLGQDTVRQLLAIRLAYDVALLPLCGTWEYKVRHCTSGSSEAKYVAHLALEHAYRSDLVKKLGEQPSPAVATRRKALQAVFCIDVRSEVYRRALEAQSTEIETLGFAGFFGMPLEVSSTARCPVLIAPNYQVGVERATSPLGGLGERVAEVWKHLADSAAACFSAVEVGGLWFGIRMLQRIFARPNRASSGESLQWAIPVTERVQLAAGAIRNMSIDATRLAPVILLCGHGSSTENNPYESSLDCGACGGHKGDINARFAAALLNDPEVREGLKARGIPVPEDSVFIAGLHNTTTDEVTVYDSETLLSKDQCAQVARWLQSASVTARRERSGNLVPVPSATNDPQLQKETQRRSADWSEVRPEWGLAGNAAFVAAPRSRTAGLNLKGRVFLHEYDPLADHDGSVLGLILNAPVIVASWINLQYFASTVNNRLFGSGNKVLHNVVGKFGIWEGNGGDLRTGLPLQSLHDGEQWIHEPLRLHVVVQAPRDRVDQILKHSPDVRNLVDNHWIYLLAIDDDVVYGCDGAGRWRVATEGSW